MQKIGQQWQSDNPKKKVGNQATTPHNVTTPHFSFLTLLNYISLVGEVWCGAVCGVGPTAIVKSERSRLPRHHATGDP
jgi:hypothetical protein